MPKAADPPRATARTPLTREWEDRTVPTTPNRTMPGSGVPCAPGSVANLFCFTAHMSCKNDGQPGCRTPSAPPTSATYRHPRLPPPLVKATGPPDLCLQKFAIRAAKEYFRQLSPTMSTSGFRRRGRSFQRNPRSAAQRGHCCTHARRGEMCTSSAEARPGVREASGCWQFMNSYRMMSGARLTTTRPRNRRSKSFVNNDAQAQQPSSGAKGCRHVLPT